MKYFNFFRKLGGWQDELKQPLNSMYGSIQDEKQVIVPMMEFKNVEMDQESEIEEICERLDLIKEKLGIEKPRIKDQHVLEAKVKSNLSISFSYMGLSGISSFACYNVIRLFQNWKSVVAQGYENYYHQPINQTVNNQTCYQTNGYPYCDKPSDYQFIPESLINILGNQIQSIAMNTTQVCQRMGIDYCLANTSKNWTGFGMVFIGLVAATSLVIGGYYANRRENDNCCSSCLKPKEVLAREILSEEDQDFLSDLDIHVGPQTVNQMVDEIINKKIDLRVRKRPNYEPTLFNEIVRDYINPNDSSGRQFMSSFN